MATNTCTIGFMVGETIDSGNVDALLDDVAGHLNAQHGRLIDLTVWLLANPFEWQGDGGWTAAQFLAWRCGVSASTAAQHRRGRRAGQRAARVDRAGTPW